MKKRLSLILAIAMALALSVCAFASGGPAAEAVEVTDEGFGAYVNYLRQYIADCDDPEFNDEIKEMALGDLYAATEAQAIAEEFPVEMFTGAHGALSYAQRQAANG